MMNTILRVAEAICVMAGAEAINGVNEVLRERGVEQKPTERLADFVARTGITPQQAEVLLQAMHSGAGVSIQVVVVFA